jgi:FtsP/CotA-like multicopper oxidase with cupredoxin domain
MRYFARVLIFCTSIISINAYADTVSYSFDVDYKEVNMTGRPVMAMSINNQIPAPTIEATVGDTLKITINNKMDVETSVHWHGILLPNNQDGVPYLTTPAIKAKSSFTFEFPVIHSGTYWYHSHTGLQEQRGIYGTIVFHEREQRYEYDVEKVIVLSDWTNENPQQVLRHLKREDDYYALKKDAVQSWDKVFANGWPALKARFNHARIRMGAMDISDVGYDAFLINGKQQSKDETIKPGSKVRLRIINAGASSYFYVDYAGGDMTIIEADGVAVMPVKVERLKLAIAETYDVIIEIPDDKKSYELRATSEDVTGYASLYLGKGDIVKTKDIAKPNPFIVDHTMHMTSMKHDKHKNHDMMTMHHGHEPEIKMLNQYEGLRSPEHTTLALENPQREVVLKLTGSMERYVWSFNNKTLSEEDKILIKKGENVRFILKNETMMHHPLHLHGHFFRVLNGEGAHAPLKHTVNVPPFETVVIEFFANEEKDWFFHCHNLYHMKNGMARVVRYQDSAPDNDEFYQKLKKHGDPWYSFVDAAFHTNMMAGELWSMNTRNTLKLHYDFDYDHEYDIDAIYERHFGRFLGVYAGVNLERDSDEISNTAITGINYTLPLLIESSLRFDSDGQFRFQLHSDYQLTKRTSFDWVWNTDDEYRFRLNYDFNKKISGVLNYDSDFDFGAGLEFHF